MFDVGGACPFIPELCVQRTYVVVVVVVVVIIIIISLPYFVQ